MLHFSSGILGKVADRRENITLISGKGRLTEYFTFGGCAGVARRHRSFLPLPASRSAPPVRGPPSPVSLLVSPVPSLRLWSAPVGLRLWVAPVGVGIRV